MADPDKYRRLLHRTILSQVVIVVIFLVSLAGYNALSAQKPQVATKDIAPTVLNVDTFQVAPVTFREILTAYGTARPDRQVVVAAQVSGEIVEVHPQLEVGQIVSAARSIISAETATRRDPGDVLVQIDERDYANRVRQTQNRINEASREIEQLQQQEQNAKRLLKKSREDLVAFEDEYQRARKALDAKVGAEAAVTRTLVDLQRQNDAVVQLENQVSLFPHQVAAAKERLSTSEAELERATDDLKRTRVVAPFDGILSEVMAEQGQFVRMGEPLFRITDPSRIEIPVSIGLDDWHQISSSLESGHSPVVSLAASEVLEADWTGAIVRVAPEADPVSRTIEAYVEVQNQEQSSALLPGTFVHARITGSTNENTIVIPRESIFDGHVFVVDTEQQVHQVPVTQGRKLKSLVVVTRGLTGGEQIATTNLNILEDGLHVDVQETATLETELADQVWPLIDIAKSQSIADDVVESPATMRDSKESLAP